MSIYAKINSENIVENVIVCEDNQVESLSGSYIKVSDLTNQPLIGYPYNSQKNKFESPKPYDSWILNEETLVWQSPKGAKPEGFYRWEEESQEWVALS